MLDLWYTSMSYDIGSTTTKTRDPENVWVAVGIFSLCALELEICRGSSFTPVAGKRRKKPLPGQGLTPGLYCNLLGSRDIISPDPT